MRKLMCLAATLLLCACNQDDLLQKISSPEEQAHAKEVIQHLREGDFPDIEKALDPTMRVKNLHETLMQMSGMIPPGTPDSVKLVGAHFYTLNGAKTIESVFEYDFGGKWLLISVMFKRQDDTETIYGLHVLPEEHPYSG